MGRRVLAIDDSSSVRKLVEYSLGSRGFQVSTASDGVEALELLSRQSFDAIILDINMPRLDGFKFLKMIKRKSAFSHIPVVMLTTEGQEEDEERALQMGAFSYLVKPFRPSELVRLIERILS